MTNPNKKFNLGHIEVLFFAEKALKRAGQKAEEFLGMHQKGICGEITPDEQEQNEINIKRKKGKVLSAHIISTEEIIWILTDLSKTETTVMLPREYDLIEKFNIT